MTLFKLPHNRLYHATRYTLVESKNKQRARRFYIFKIYFNGPSTKILLREIRRPNLDRLIRYRNRRMGCDGP